MTDKTSKPEAPPAQPAELKDDKLDAVVGAGQTSNFSDGAQSYGLPLTDNGLFSGKGGWAGKDSTTQLSGTDLGSGRVK